MGVTNHLLSGMILQVVETLYCIEIAMFFSHYASPIRFSLVFEFIQQEFGVWVFQRILYIQKLCKGKSFQLLLQT